MKEIAFITLGCRLNKAETDEIINQLQKSFRVAQSSKADIFIINTCSVTSQAFKRSFRTVADLRKKNPGAKIVVCGCAAKDLKDDLLEADHIFTKEDQSGMSTKIIQLYGEQMLEQTSIESTYARPLIKIQDGCNNYCSYCIVAYLRGNETSRNYVSIIREVKAYEQDNYSEVVLSGVNIGRYKSADFDLAQLLKAILQETKTIRVRLSSINPNDFNEELIQIFKDGRICDHVHLSLQSGSDDVLKRMNRKYTVKDYKRVVSDLRAVRPDIAVTTDIIVGFPGETDGEFEETLEFVRKLRLSKIHVFRYSKREGTAAAKMIGQLSGKVKKERSDKLIALSNEMAHEFNRKFVGREVQVVFESKNKGLAKGVSSNFLNVYAKTNQPLRKLSRKVKIIETTDLGLYGILESE